MCNKKIYPTEIVGVSAEDLYAFGFKVDKASGSTEIPDGWTVGKEMILRNEHGARIAHFESVLVWENPNAR